MIIATAGHVDHGKTSLVRALTGIDTDRLEEEKRRGLSIDLGFAYAQTGEGRPFGVVDVPGHERFVRNMLAGVAAVDVVLLVIAADDGPMPQTREHLSILEVLGVTEGVVALTKVDRVGPVRLEEAMAEVRAMLAGTALAGIPIFPVATPVGQGLQALRAHLEAAADALPPRTAGGCFRLAIDRSFSLPGAGLIVTGAVVAGRVQVGDRLLLTPGGAGVRVRGIHAQNRPAESGQAGQRCALNIVPLDQRHVAIDRGDWLLAPSAHAPTLRLDVDLKVLQGEARALASGSTVQLHLGAAAVTGRLVLLQDRSLPPGHAGLAQLVLERPIGALRGDRFVLRDAAARRTIAGGSVLDPAPPARGRGRPGRLAWLAAMRAPTAEAALAAALEFSTDGVDLVSFERAWNLDAPASAALRSSPSLQVIATDDGGAVGISPPRWQALLAALETALAALHRDAPETFGATEAQLRRALPQPVSPVLFRGAVAALLGEGRLVRAGLALRLPGHSATLPDADAASWARLQPLIAASGLRPLTPDTLAAALGLDGSGLPPVLERLVRFGLLVVVPPRRYFPPAALGELARIAEALAGEAAERGFDAATYRDRSGIGRNVTIELLEFFDRAGLTRRVDKNTRRLLRPAADVFGPPSGQRPP